MVRIKSPQDFGAGLLFVIFGLLGIYFGRNLALGDAARMGPGYFPMLLCGLIVLVGVIVTVRGLSVRGPAIEMATLRPLFVILATLLAFVLLIDVIGLVFTTMLIAVMAAFAKPNPNLVETAIVAVVMAFFAVIVFVYGLQLPMMLWWGR